MTEWMPKAGDDVVLKLLRVTNGRGYFVDYCGFPFAVPLSELKPVPVAMTIAQAALIETAISIRKTQCTASPEYYGFASAKGIFVARVDAVIAERVPPDPVEVALSVYEKVSGIEHTNSHETGMIAALKAFVAAGGGKS